MRKEIGSFINTGSQKTTADKCELIRNTIRPIWFALRLRTVNDIYWQKAIGIVPHSRWLIMIVQVVLFTLAISCMTAHKQIYLKILLLRSCREKNEVAERIGSEILGFIRRWC